MTQSALLTPELVGQVAEILRPSIEAIIKIDPKRKAAYVVVLDPASHITATLWEGVFGEKDKTKWPNPYDKFANAKAAISRETGLSGHIVQRDRPFLYKRGDFKFGGSIVFNGIIVATSGLAWHHDLMISGMVASSLYALSIGAGEVEHARKPYFIGAPDPAPAT